MSGRNGAKVDLRVNLSEAGGNRGRVESSPNESPTSSCVSSEYSTAAMMLVGCPRCLMYVMLAEEDPRCPRCKSSVLLDIIHDDDNNNNATTATSRKSNNKS